MKVSAKYLVLVTALVGLVVFPIVMSMGMDEGDNLPEATEKINGVNFVSPSKKIGGECMLPLNRINSEWVALNPYSYGKTGEAELHFDLDWQWWGERTSGTKTLVDYARDAGKKVMIKPHVWVRGEGWGGDFVLTNEADWLSWEKNYEDYILAHAEIAEEKNVDLFCLGTEIRKSVAQRPDFWKGLIKKVRAIYKGKLTYASNWDNYHNVTFWDQLDYIGVDSYFPLSEAILPTKEALMESWKPHKQDLKKFAEKHGKPLIFTEFGYRSIDKTAWRQWELPEHWEKSEGAVNMQAQINAYEAIFESFWNEPWFGGGFLWKWYPKDGQSGGDDNRDYTPQNKPVEKLIQKWYKN